jgi:hypothetical protein
MQQCGSIEGGGVVVLAEEPALIGAVCTHVGVDLIGAFPPDGSDRAVASELCQFGAASSLRQLGRNGLR